MKPLLALLLILSTGIALAASIYKYECPTCHLIQEYGVPGIYKCASDGSILIPKLGK
jgi:cytochrome c5